MEVRPQKNKNQKTAETIPELIFLQQINDGMPLGLGMALAQNPEAMNSYARISEKEREALVTQAKAVTSKREMQELVNG